MLSENIISINIFVRVTNIATPKSVNKWFEFSRDEAVVRQSILSSHQRASYASYDAKIGSPNPLDINEALHASADALQVCQPALFSRAFQ